MTKTVVIHQPDFLPYIGFFHKLLIADLWIVYDDVQFLRRGWHHRDKIKNHHGEQWITVSIGKAPRETNINQIKISSTELWKDKHLNLLKTSYSKSPYFSEIFPYIEQLYSKTYEKLIDLNMASITMLMKLFDITIKYEFSSQYPSAYRSNERIIELLQNSEATHYLTGTGSESYLKVDLFDKANFKVIWQQFTHPKYHQLHRDFIPNLSSIDLLLNCGIEQSRQILRGIR